MKHLFTFFTLLALMMSATAGWGQVWTYDFGTATATHPTNTISTAFLTSTPSGGGTYRVRTGSAGGTMVLANPGTTLGTGTELQINAATSTASNKFGVYDWTSPSAVAYLKTGFRTTSAENGNLNFSLGVNTIGSDNQGYTSHYNNSLVSFTIAYTTGAISSVVRRISGSNTTITTHGFSKDTDHTIEIYANNSASSTNYYRGEVYSLATQTWDLWVDGIRVVTGAAKAGTLASGTNLSGFAFFAESSLSNAAWIYIDDLEYSNALPAATPTITLSDNGTQVAAGDINQGSVDIVLSKTQAAVTVANATLNSFSFTTSGSYDDDDIVNFKLRYSTDATLDAGDATLATVTSIPATGNTVTFSGLTQVINSGSTGYFFVTSDIAVNATPLNTIAAGKPTYTFASGTPTDNTTAGGLQTIQSVTPSITLADNGTQITTGNLVQNSTNYVLSSFEIAVATANAELNGLAITTTGSYIAADVSNLKLWYSSNNSFESGTDVLLQTIASPGAAGTKNFTGFNRLLTYGNTGYFFITIDAPCAATPGNTIAVSTIANTDLSFTATVTRSGSASAAGNQTITAAVINNISGLAAGVGNTQLTVSWTNPSGCYDDVMIVAKTSSSISATPSGDGSGYNANLVFGTGGATAFDGTGYVVYRGSTSPQTITGLVNGTTYYVKVFTRKGSVWSSGVEVNSTPNITTTINFDDAGKWTAGSAAITSYASDHTYIDGVFSATGGPALRNGTGTQDGFAGALGTYSWRLQDLTNVDWRITIASDGVSSFSMKIRRWDGSPSPDLNLEYSLNNGASWTLVSAINNTTLNNSSDWTTFNGVINTTTLIPNIFIRLKANGTTERIMIDDFVWTQGLPPTTYTYNGTTWSPSSPVGQSLPGDIIEITSGVATLNANTIIRNLSISNGATLEISPQISLSVDGTLTNSGTLTIKSGDTGTGSLITNGSVTGNIVVERYIPGATEQWHLVSSPVSGQGISGGWTPDGSYPDGSGYDFYAWHEAGQLWVNRKNTASNPQGSGPRFDDAAVNNGLNFTAAKGYLTAFQAATPTKSFTGAPFNSTQTYTLSKSGTGSYVGLNLVGNPFPSTIAGNNSADATNNFLAANASVLDDSYVAYYYLDNGNYTAINQSSSAHFIAVGQGLFVVAKNNAGSLSFNTNIRKHGSSTFYKNSDDRNALKIHLQASTGKADATELFFQNDMTTSLDPGYDAAKLLGFSGVNVYTKLVAGGNTKFDIQALPIPNDNMVVALGLSVTEAGTYNFTFEPTQQYLNSIPQTFLLDKLTNTQIQLSPGSSYGFTIAEAGDFNNRFELRFGALNIIDKPAAPALLAHVAAGQLHVFNLKGAVQLEIYDLAGRRLQHHSIMADGTYTRPLALPAGVYVVRATSEQSSKAVKVIVQ